MNCRTCGFRIVSESELCPACGEQNENQKIPQNDEPSNPSSSVENNEFEEEYPMEDANPLEENPNVSNDKHPLPFGLEDAPSSEEISDLPFGMDFAP